MATEGFYLGGVVDGKTGERTGGLVDYDPGDLTTHGVIVGMTGSGKTGLGIIYLEEALLAGIPTLILDPKGDMTNLMLTFPELRPADFEPWIDEGEARKEEKTATELATEKAELWKKGLGWWDQDGSRIRELRNKAGFTIYTPGSTAGVPLNIIGSLTAPDADWDTEAEALRDEIEGFVSGLLGLVEIEADPISSREHILIANLIENAWRANRDLDMASLLAEIQRPPLRKLGVFELDTFFPEKDRMALAMRLNGLVASPAFSSWIDGPDLDIESLLWQDGKPQAAIVYLAHLSDEERQFIVTLILSKVITWMRAQAGTGDLRALVYMDEVFGFVPPTAEPPAKKPILTLLKQARAFGVGLLLSTQNPVDLDYKAMSNAGTWCIGRLQTERDKARILEALQSARGDTDIGQLDKTISGLEKRQFLLHNTREPEPILFTTRWALSYLRGPLTREQIASLTNYEPEPVSSEPEAADAAAPEQLATDETPVMPKVAEGIPVYHLAPDAPWGKRFDADPASHRYTAAIAARVNLTYDERAANLMHQEEWEAIVTPLELRLDAGNAVYVDYDERDLLPQAPDDARYVIPEGAIDKSTYWRGAESALKEFLYRGQKITIFKNAALKMYSRAEEAEEAFRTRCDMAAQEKADAEAAKLRDRYERRFTTLRNQIAAAERRAEEIAVDLQGARQQEIIEGAGSVINILLGRRSTRSVTGSARNRRTTRSKETRLRTAQAKADDKYAELQDLEADLVEELEEINDRWENRGEEIEQVEVGLEKSDIQIAETALVWLPIG
ncbi:MAG: ATP-binding protein [Acidimicrobiia bacterium]|nr:ATP-binding protein [Acidimicrobiia bacterium]